MIIYHPLQRNDLKYLVDLFNEQFVYDKITEEILHEKVFHEEDYDNDLNFLVKKDNVLSGFASGYVREYENKKVGWIKLIAAVDQKDPGPIFADLFSKIESKLIMKGAVTIRFLDSFPNYFVSGIDPRYTSIIALLHQRGYEKRRDNVQMTTDLTTKNFSTLTAENQLFYNHNISIKRASESDKNRVMELINIDFKAWRQEIAMAFQKERLPLHIAVKDKKVIAFSNHSCNNIGQPWFGPMGTTEKAQGKGIGEILLKRCLQDLKDAGHKKAIIPWVGPIAFYFQKCNAEVTRIFWNYTKSLT